MANRKVRVVGSPVMVDKVSRGRLTTFSADTEDPEVAHLLESGHLALVEVPPQEPPRLHTMPVRAVNPAEGVAVPESDED